MLGLRKEEGRGNWGRLHNDECYDPHHIFAIKFNNTVNAKHKCIRSL
jgi:hypothetical protein